MAFQEQKQLHLEGAAYFSEKDERLVWQQFLEGDDQSLIYIYNKYVHVLYAYGKQLADRHELIRDCIQELFCDLIDKRSGLSKAHSVKAYLLTSLKRRLLKELKKDRKYELEEDGFSFSFAEVPVSLTHDLTEKDLKVIHEKLNLLSTNQREAIYLHFYEGLSYAEIANILAIKVASARILTYRALSSLQTHLEPLIGSFYSIIMLFVY